MQTVMIYHFYRSTLYNHVLNFCTSFFNSVYHDLTNLMNILKMFNYLQTEGGWEVDDWGET